MLCCSSHCERYNDCARAMIHNVSKEEQIENLYSYGSCSIQWVDGEIVKNENYICGPAGNWSMFIKWINPHTEEEKKMDNLKICIEITPYVKNYNSGMELDFNHPVQVRSVSQHDELVEITYEGKSFFVSQSELNKAIDLATHFR